MIMHKILGFEALSGFMDCLAELSTLYDSWVQEVDLQSG